MKNILRALILILLSISISNAQETIVPLEDKPNTDVYSGKYYFKDVNNKLKQFTGTWKYEGANETLEITFFKEERDESGGDASDILNSNFVYTRNGVTVFDTFPLTTEDDIFIFGDYIKNSNTMMLYYSEPNSDRLWSAQLFIEVNESLNLEDPVTLNWRIKTSSTKTVNGQKVYPYEIPSNLVLIKQ